MVSPDFSETALIFVVDAVRAAHDHSTAIEPTQGRGPGSFPPMATDERLQQSEPSTQR
jgi:hypothetical protein